MLDNKLGINNSTDLAREEERISKKKAVELFENNILDTLEVGKFSTLQTIHKYLFEDIYDFAGKLRNVNIAKGNFRFAPIIYIEEALKNIDKMPQSTNAAISSGLEWNVKVTRKDLPETIEKIAATFESYWNSSEFEYYDEGQRERLTRALKAEKYSETDHSGIYTLDILPYSYQQEILDRLDAERTVRGYNRNLVVAATGTGKTVISALDYKRFCKQHPGQPCRLLFVAHREEILNGMVLANVSLSKILVVLSMRSLTVLSTKLLLRLFLTSTLLFRQNFRVLIRISLTRATLTNVLANGKKKQKTWQDVSSRTSLSLQVTKLVRLWLLLVRNSNLYIRYIEKGGSERSRLFVS